MEKILSVQGGKATQYIFKDKPSKYVPFKGKFPLAEEYQQKIIYERIQNNKHLDDIPEEWIRELIVKGEKMYDIEDAFQDYLRDMGKFDGFLKLKNSEKADLLLSFMDKNCISMEALKM